MALSKKTYRKTFLFPESGLSLLNWLQSACHVRTDADVVRYAIGALSDLMMAIKKGDEIVIRSKDGSERRYNPVFELDQIDPDPIEDLKAFRSDMIGRAA